MVECGIMSHRVKPKAIVRGSARRAFTDWFGPAKREWPTRSSMLHLRPTEAELLELRALADAGEPIVRRVRKK